MAPKGLLTNINLNSFISMRISPCPHSVVFNLLKCVFLYNSKHTRKMPQASHAHRTPCPHSPKPNLLVTSCSLSNSTPASASFSSKSVPRNLVSSALIYLLRVSSKLTLPSWSEIHSPTCRESQCSQPKPADKARKRTRNLKSHPKYSQFKKQVNLPRDKSLIITNQYKKPLNILTLRS